VKAELIVRIAEDALLYEHNVHAALLDLLEHVEDVLPLVAEYAIHGRIVGNDDTVVQTLSVLGAERQNLDARECGALIKWRHVFLAVSGSKTRAEKVKKKDDDTTKRDRQGLLSFSPSPLLLEERYQRAPPHDLTSLIITPLVDSPSDLL
jgi:hypothetical protein